MCIFTTNKNSICVCLLETKIRRNNFCTQNYSRPPVLWFYAGAKKKGKMIESMKTDGVSVRDGGKTADRRGNRELGKPTENRWERSPRVFKK